MNKLLFAIMALCMLAKHSIGQVAYNPFTQNIHFAPEPTAAGFECGTVQTVVFTQGLTTAADATQWQTEPLKVTICLGGFVFNGPAASVVAGSYASNFNWAYDPFSPNCIIGTQNQIIKGTGPNPIFVDPLSSGPIELSLLVPANSPVSTVLSVNVTLQVPPYMATFNSQPDDNESTQTQTFCGCYALTNPGLISGNQTFCGQGNPTAFSSLAQGSGGSGGVILYQWQFLNGSNWTDIAGATDETYTAGPTTASLTYRRNAKRSLCGTWLNSDSVIITINPLPMADAGADVDLNCTTTSAQIGAAPTSGLAYTWSPTSALSSTSSAQPMAHPLLSTIYTLTVTDANNCSSSDLVNVNVDNVPPIANAGPDKDLNCTNLSSQIGTSALVGNSYAWLPSIGLSANNIAQPMANPTSTTTYSLTVTGANGCVANDEVVVNVDQAAPFVDAGPDKDLNCLTAFASIGSSPLPNYFYAWSPVTNLSDFSSANPIANPLQNITYTITVTGANGCIATDVVAVNVDNIAPIADAGLDKSICFGDSTMIGSPAISGNAYSWLPNSSLNNASIAQPIAKPTSTTNYVLTVTGQNGCTSLDTVEVMVNFCPVNVYGTVYKDTNELTNLKVDGLGINTADGEKLFVHLVGSNGLVLAISELASDGTYEFLNVPANQTYTLVLSNIQGVVGSQAPTPDLPGTWVNTGEDCCDDIGHDFNPNGLLSIVVVTTDIHMANFGIKDPNATGFPVILKNVMVSEYNCQAMLSWTTLQEEHTSHTEIYRQEDGNSSFEKIAMVQNAGTSSSEIFYSYLDKEVKTNAIYHYRLKFVDIDGQFTNSDIKTISLNCEGNSAISFFPNPVVNELNVIYVNESNDADLMLEVMDMTGRKLLHTSQELKSGANLIKVDVSHLAKGNYILHYQDVEGLNKGAMKFLK